MTTYNVDIVVNGRNNASGPLAGVGSALGRVGQIATGILASQVFTKVASAVWDFASGSITAASDLNESFNKVQQIFGSSYDSIIGWSKTAATSVGLSQQAALDAASSFGVFGSAAGLTGNELAKFGEDNTQLAADMASFYNTTVPDAVQALSAALRGETEPIRRYGVLIDDMSLRQEALTLGIVSTTKKALTPQQRVLAAQALIMKQTSKVQGDFGRTSGGLANQQRILAAQIENAQIQLGTIFLPVVTKVMGFLNTTGIEVLNNVIDKFTAITQPILDFQGVMERMGPVNAVIKTLKDMLKGMGVDVDSGPMSLFFANLRGDLDYAFGLLGKWKDVFASAMDSEIVKNFRDGFDGFVSFFQTQGPPIIKLVQDLAAKLIEAFGPVVTDIVTTASETFAKVGKWFSDNGPLISKTLKVLADGFGWMAGAVAGMWKVIKPLLTGLGDLLMNVLKAGMQSLTGDFKGYWETIKLATIAALLAIGTSLLNLLDWIAGLFGGSMSEISATWSENWRLLGEIIKQYLKIAWDGVVKWWTDLNATWDENGKLLRSIASTLWKNLVDAIKAKLASFYESGRLMITNIINGFKASITSLWNTVSGAISSALTTAFEGVRRFVEVGATIITKIKDGISQSVSNIANGIREAINGAYDAASGAMASFAAIGKGIVDNLVAGISAGGQSIIDALVALVKAALVVIKAMLGIKSGGGDTPQAFRDFGANIAASLNAGLTGANLSHTLALNGGGGGVGGMSTNNNSRTQTNYFGPITNVLSADNSDDWLKRFR